MLTKIAKSMRIKAKVWLVLPLVSLFALAFSSVLFAVPPNAPITQVYFFGDSFTDSGFNNRGQAIPGKAPTFTTFGGYIWSQYIARDLKDFVLPVYPGTFPTPPNPPDLITNNATQPRPVSASGTLTGVDYAAAGSRTNASGVGTIAPSLHQQVLFHIASAGGFLDPNAVYFIWAGFNDFLGAVLAAAPNIPSQTSLLQVGLTAATNIANDVELLFQSGARRIVVLTLPSIGLTPQFSLIAQARQRPDLPGVLKNLTFTFNAMLNGALGEVQKRQKQNGSRVIVIDIFGLFNDIINKTSVGMPYQINGQSFTFTNYQNAACGFTSPGTFRSAIACPSSTANSQFLYADGWNPAAQTHRVISLFVEQNLVFPAHV